MDGRCKRLFWTVCAFVLQFAFEVVQSQSAPVVEWEMGMYGVKENAGSVRICAIISPTMNITAQATASPLSAEMPEDFFEIKGSNATFHWTNANNRTCNSIHIVNDDAVESEEVFVVSFVQAIERNLSFPQPDLSSRAMVMIMDDDVVSVSFNSKMYEVDQEDKTAELVLVKTGRAAINITVNVQVQNITTTSGKIFRFPIIRITFRPVESEKSVPVEIPNDDKITEEFTAILSADANYENQVRITQETATIVVKKNVADTSEESDKSETITIVSIVVPIAVLVILVLIVGVILGAVVYCKSNKGGTMALTTGHIIELPEFKESDVLKGNKTSDSGSEEAPKRNEYAEL